MRREKNERNTFANDVAQSEAEKILRRTERSKQKAKAVEKSRLFRAQRLLAKQAAKTRSKNLSIADQNTEKA